MTEEATPKQAAENPEKSASKTVTEEPKKTTKKPVEKKPEVIFIGNKPPMSYVMAPMTALSSSANTEITLLCSARLGLKIT